LSTVGKVESTTYFSDANDHTVIAQVLYRDATKAHWNPLLAQLLACCQIAIIRPLLIALQAAQPYVKSPAKEKIARKVAHSGTHNIE
jgi:hypothetical protein